MVDGSIAAVKTQRHPCIKPPMYQSSRLSKGQTHLQPLHSQLPLAHKLLHEMHSTSCQVPGNLIATPSRTPSRGHRRHSTYPHISAANQQATRASAKGQCAGHNTPTLVTARTTQHDTSTRTPSSQPSTHQTNLAEYSYRANAEQLPQRVLV
jgi:hypothetical protein